MKDGINDYVVHAVKEAVNPAQRGTKAAGTLHRCVVGAGGVDGRAAAID